jgi:hypothetical protein
MSSTALKQILADEATSVYNATEKLFKKVLENELQWKPATGKNWMTVGQVLMHCADGGCGKAVKGFITGDWGMPENAGSADQQTEYQLPPAEALPSVKSVDEALQILADDKALTLKLFAEIDESQLLSKKLAAPWGGPEAALFHQLLMMINHLAQHKRQLFYYLKLMGKDVNTGDLWGM